MRVSMSFVAATLPWEVINSLKVNIMVTRFEVENKSKRPVCSVTISAWWKLTFAGLNFSLAASVRLARIGPQPGHESMTSTFTIISFFHNHGYIDRIMKLAERGSHSHNLRQYMRLATATLGGMTLFVQRCGRNIMLAWAPTGPHTFQALLAGHQCPFRPPSKSTWEMLQRMTCCRDAS